MTPAPDDVTRVFHAILHRGLVQIRALAGDPEPDRRQVVHDLADELEVLPQYLADWRDECWEIARSGFARLQARYPGVVWDYTHLLDAARFSPATPVGTNDR